MMLDLDYDGLVKTFDKLVEEEVLVYTPPKTINRTYDGFKTQFTISGSLVTKPQAGQPIAQSVKRTFGPGSDLAFNDERELICKVGTKATMENKEGKENKTNSVNNDNGDEATHLLIFNKFPIFRPMLLLLTADSYQRQWEPLDRADLGIMFDVLQAIQPPSSHSRQEFYAIFNCGMPSGASRQHKHMQILPKPENFTMLPDSDDFDCDGLPFECFIRYLKPEDRQHVDRLTSIYLELLGEVRKSLCKPSDRSSDQSDHLAHNVVATLDWILVVPRRNACFQGANGPNSSGMIGLISLDNEEKIECWEKFGPLNAWAHCGVPTAKKDI